MKIYRVILCIVLISNFIFLQSIGDLRKIKKIKDKEIKNLLNDYSHEIEDSTIDNVDSNIPKFEVDTLDIKQNYQENLKYFGYSYFLNKTELLKIDNLPVPANYLLGPGDEIIINVWGEIQSSSAYDINRDGNVFIEDLGQINLSGLSIKSAKDILKIKFSNIYSTLKGENATTFFDISLGKLKSININIVGAANNPSLYTVHPFSTISMCLIQAGGINEKGTLREIILIRDGKEISTYDFYDFVFNGNDLNDIQVKNNDIIFISSKISDVEIKGEVNQSMIYEIRENEVLADIIRYAGGLNINAINLIEINRILSGKDRQNNHSNFYQNYYVDLDEYNVFNLQDGDFITVRPIGENYNYITIQGQVKNSGKYSVTDNLTLLNVIKMSGGIEDSTYKKSMNLLNVDVVRINPDSKFPIVFNINVQDILDNKNPDFLLHDLDYVSIKKNPNFIESEIVELSGEVLSPGYYSIIHKNESLYNIINRAGGFTDLAYIDGIQMFRGDNQVILKNSFNIKVTNEDKIVVPKRSDVVTVQGEVYNPGIVQYVKNKNLIYYIKSAGGYNKNADKKDITVIYPSGDVKINSIFSKPKVVDGCTIVIHKKELSEPINKTEMISNLASIITSLSTVIYIIDQTGN